MQHELPSSSSENTFLFSCPRDQHSSFLPTKSSLNCCALLFGAFLMQVPNQVICLRPASLTLHSGPACPCSLCHQAPVLYFDRCSPSAQNNLFLCVYSTYTGTYSTLLFSEWSLPFCNCFSSFTHTPPCKLSSSSMLGLPLLLLLTIAHCTTTLPVPQQFCIQPGMYQVLSKSPLM